MIKVKIYKSIATNAIELFIYEERNGKRYVAKPVKLVFEEWKEGEIIKPTLIFYHFVGEEFLKSLAEALDEKGIKTEQDAKIAGTLEATRYHLEDLRKLLKLK